jgi:hypothetical protein
MSKISSTLISEKIRDVIRHQDGKLGWHEIAAAVGANVFAERGDIFIELRTLERRGIVRRQHGEGDARYWIVDVTANSARSPSSDSH